MRRHEASATAKVIAAATIFLHAQRPQYGLTSQRAAELCVAFLATARADRTLASAAARPCMAPLWWALERATLPGIIVHYARRKASIEHWVRSQLRGAAIQRVVVLGAGFDTLALRLAPEFPTIQFIEIDHPATQSVKREALAAIGAVANNIAFQAADLSAATLPPLFDPTDPARLTIAEGLLMYFGVNRVTEILSAALHSGSSASNVMIFSYMEQRDHLPAGFRPRSRLIDTWLQFKREPFLWSASEQALHAVVDKAGGAITAVLESTQFAAGQLPGAARQGALSGENLVAVQASRRASAR
jgi:O-methyltransferase involved in polyketide biosynthesis